MTPPFCLANVSRAASFVRARRRRLSKGASYFFFFNDTATTDIYPLSLHDALPISTVSPARTDEGVAVSANGGAGSAASVLADARSEEHTSELQSRRDLVCRLL